MKIGAERQKIGILIALLVVAAVVFYMNSGPSSETVYTSPASASPAASAGTPSSAAVPSARQRGRTSSNVQFTPSLRPKRGEQRPDPMTIDPTLRLDLLAKLQTVNVEGTRRSIFDFSQPPPPKVDPVKTAGTKPVPDPLVPVKPLKPVEEAKAEPAKPSAPPIPLKFYGYVSPAGVNAGPRRAFFVEGEDIFVAHEGEMLKKRYKIVRIGVNSAVVEDTQFGSQQTLPLEEQQG